MEFSLSSLNVYEGKQTQADHVIKDSGVTLETPAFLKFIPSAQIGPFKSDRAETLFRVCLPLLGLPIML